MSMRLVRLLVYRISITLSVIRGREPAATPGPQVLKSGQATQLQPQKTPRNNSVGGFALPARRSAICE
jgi:hypothetical protein